MTIILNNTGNPINRTERIKINENWDRIIAGLTEMQYQINMLAGGEDVQKLLEAIHKALDNIAEAQRKTDELIVIINKAADNADAKAKEAETATQNANIASQKALEAVNNVTVALADLDLVKQATMTATQNANDATVSATQASVEAKDAAKFSLEETEKAIKNINDTISASLADMTVKVDTSLQNVQVAIEASNKATTDNTQATFNAITEAETKVNTAVQNADNATERANIAAEGAEQATEAIKGWGTATVWSADTAYERNNVVTENGSTWQATKANTNSKPSLTNTDWIMLAQRGVDGTGSVSSVNGVLPNEKGDVHLDLGQGTVKKVNGKGPNAEGEVTLEATDLGVISGDQLTDESVSLAKLSQDVQDAIKKGGGGLGNAYINAYTIPTIIESQKTWDVPVNTYDAETDTMLLYHNTGLLDTESWTLTGEAATGYQVNIPDNPETAIEDNNVIIVVLRNAPTVPGGTDISGTRLTDGSVALAKLGQDVQDAISNAGNAEIVKQWVKDHGVGDSLKIITEGSIIALRESGKYTVISSGASNTFIPTTVADGVPIEIEVSIYKNGTDELRGLYKISYFDINDSQFKSFMRDKGIDFPDDDSAWIDTTSLNNNEYFKIISPTLPTTKPNDPIFQDGVTTFSSYNSATFAKEWVESLGLVYPSQGNNAVVSTKKDPNNLSRLIQEVLVTLGSSIVGRFARGGAGTQSWGAWKRLTFDIVNDSTTGGTDKAASAETVKKLQSEVDSALKVNTYNANSTTINLGKTSARRVFPLQQFSIVDKSEQYALIFPNVNMYGVLKITATSTYGTVNAAGGCEINVLVGRTKDSAAILLDYNIVSMSPTFANNFLFAVGSTVNGVTLTFDKKQGQLTLSVSVQYDTVYEDAYSVLQGTNLAVGAFQQINNFTPQQSIFTHVGNSKADLATAITGKGVATSADATFATMVANINAIPTGKRSFTTTAVTDSVPMVFNYVGLQSSAGLYYIIVGSEYGLGTIIATCNTGSNTYQSVYRRIDPVHGDHVTRVLWATQATSTNTNYSVRAYLDFRTPGFQYMIPVSQPGTYTVECFER